MPTAAGAAVRAAGYGCDSTRSTCRSLQTMTAAATILVMTIAFDLTQAATAT